VTPVITHLVDTIANASGAVDEEYNYLVYAFGTESMVIARTYVDEIRTVSITAGEPTPEIMAYLQERFTHIDRLGKRGYETIWRLTGTLAHAPKQF
jgi:hypothetical protein